VIDGVNAGQFSEHELCNLAHSVGASQAQDIARDAKFQSDAYHSISSHDSSSWLRERNRVLIAFLEGVAGKLKSVMKPKKFLALVMCVELIYFLRFLNFIGPLSFRINLIQYFSSASKVVATLNGASSPSGGYDTVRKWIKKHATPFKLPSPNPDIITFFDNDQVLAKTYKIQLHNKLQVSTITNYLHIQPSHNIPSIQIHPHLSPIVWLDFDLHHIQKNMQLLQTYELNLERIFNTAFTSYLHQHMTQIHTQLRTAHDPTNTTNNSNTIPPVTNKYDFVSSQHPSAIPSKHLGEPSMFNPNSYQNVLRALQTIQSSTNLSNSTPGRHWTVVGCDGLPYYYGSRLQPRTFQCSQCSLVISTGKDAFQKHLQEHNLEGVDITPYRSLGNILLIPGAGHFEMILIKSLFKLGWGVFVEQYSEVIGHLSSKSKSYFLDCADHHKSFESLEVILEVTTKVLLTLYVKHCMQCGKEPSVVDFKGYINGLHSPKFTFTFHYLRFIYALFVYRAGIRKNNQAVMLSGRTVCSGLLYILSHPKYREIEHRDLLQRVQAPPEVIKFLGEYEGISSGGDSSRGEGGDFVLEDSNKKVKALLPPGPPSESHWTVACRSVDTLTMVSFDVNKEIFYRH